MPIIKSSEAPTFTRGDMVVTGLASPSRGSRETSTWRLSLAPGCAGTQHSVDREEIFVVLAGTALVTLDGTDVPLAAGDTLIVPPHTPFALANPSGVACEALAIFPVGGLAKLPSSEAFVPPWAV
jgi:mannose-6-phosphate isomerase-like protein (cupin superfamily)